MFPSKTLLFPIFTMSYIVGASPFDRHTDKASISFVTKIHGCGSQNIAEKDQARALAMKQIDLPSKRSISLHTTNTGITYATEIGVGEPATTYTLVIDTGSANTFLGANKPYVPTRGSKNTGNSVLVNYGSGYFSGEEWLDTVTLAPGLVINHQSIGVANSSIGFTGVDGILAVGPVKLSSNTVSNTSIVPTVSNNLYSQGTISEEVLGIYFVPAINSSSSGELTFGGYDDSVVVSPVDYVPLTKTLPASKYWGINQSISYDGIPILSTTAGIVDTGTTLVLIATDAFQKYQNATGGILDLSTGLLSITSAQYANLRLLTFNIGNRSYTLTPDAQIWPRSLNAIIGGNSTAIYLIVGDIGTPSGSGLDFINGYTFLERYYSVYDVTKKRVGFAPTMYTKSKVN